MPMTREMTRESVFNTVVEIIRPFARNESAGASIGESTLILSDLKVNSARMVDIILDLEDRFDIQIDDESADSAKSVGDIVDLVTRKLAAKN